MPEPHLALRRQRQWGKEVRAIMDSPQGGNPRPAFVTSENKTEAEKKRRNGKTSLPCSLKRERNNDRILLVWKTPFLLNDFKEGT